MSEVLANLKNFFLSVKPPILKVEVGFFSDRPKYMIGLTLVLLGLGSQGLFWLGRLARDHTLNFEQL